jgi:putative acetyltransferase
MLISELDAQLDPLYPSTSRYGYSVEKLIAQGVVFFILRDGEMPVGCGGLQYFGNEYAEIKRLYVRETFRSQGFAQRMLEHLTNHAHRQNVTTLRLETGMYQHAAIKLYERFGFVPIPRFGDYRDDQLSRFYEKQL